MTRAEIIRLVRQLISDEQESGFTDGGILEEAEGTGELLNYLDRAVDSYSRRGADDGDISLLKKASVASLTTLPDDFIKFAGNVPAEVTGGVATFYGHPAGKAIPIRYFARLPWVTACGDGDELPYRHDQAMTIAALAAIYALNKHEFSVSQDLMLLGMGAGEANANPVG